MVEYFVCFDVIICMEMFEYVLDFVFIICVVVEFVKLGVDVFFLILNKILKVYLFVIVGVEKFLKMVFEGIYDYKKFIKFV